MSSPNDLVYLYPAERLARFYSEIERLKNASGPRHEFNFGFDDDKLDFSLFEVFCAALLASPAVVDVAFRMIGYDGGYVVFTETLMNPACRIESVDWSGSECTFLGNMWGNFGSCKRLVARGVVERPFKDADDDFPESLIDQMKRCTLESLDCSHNSIRDGEIEYLKTVVAHCNGLRRVELRNVKFDADVDEAVRRELKELADTRGIELVL